VKLALLAVAYIVAVLAGDWQHVSVLGRWYLIVVLLALGVFYIVSEAMERRQPKQ
jgi:hypothetical protein